LTDSGPAIIGILSVGMVVALLLERLIGRRAKIIGGVVLTGLLMDAVEACHMNEII
jgi:hypothetical protein